MRAVCFERTETVALREIAEPALESDRDAIVEVEMAGLCGSDLHVFHGRETGLDHGTVMGHEMVGRIIALGPAVKNLQLGDRVATPFSTSCGQCYFCRHGLTSRCDTGQLFGWRSAGNGLHGCQAERVRVPLSDTTLVRLPESVSAELGILLGDNLSTGFYCSDLAGVADAESCAVVGCGTVGLAAITAARSSGARIIVAVDQIDHRRAMAERLGAIACSPDQAIQAVRSATDGRGADAVMELVGLPAAQALAYDLLRPGGTMGVIGCHCTPQFAFSPVQAYDKNMTYRTGRCPARHYMDRLLPDASEFSALAETVVTHRFKLSECVEAYEVFSHRKDQCVKAVFVRD